MSASNIWVVVGTRPEAIKMAPVIRELRQRPQVRTELCVVRQQNGLLDDALREWKLQPDRVIAPSPTRHDPAAFLAAVLEPLEAQIREANPDFVMVHGDTATTYAGALAAFYAGRPVAHVEAGLRTGDLTAPFPEEMHRALIDRLSTVLYAPTLKARQNLLAEGCDPGKILVVGNTVIDAIDYTSRHSRSETRLTPPDRRTILVTGHRRESFGAGLEGVCKAVRRLAQERDDIHVVYVLHPHPEAHGPMLRILSSLPRVDLIAPISYRRFVALMDEAYLILTDSGGIQDEAPWLGTPVLVTRENTERTEAIEAGVARLVGLRPASIVKAVHELLDDADAYASMARHSRPFGEPGVSRRICDDLTMRCRQSYAS